MEAVLDDNVRYEDGGVSREFKAKFCEIIIEHLLPHPKDQVFELERRKEKKSLLGCIIWCQKSIGEAKGYDEG